MTKVIRRKNGGRTGVSLGAAGGGKGVGWANVGVRVRGADVSGGIGARKRHATPGGSGATVGCSPENGRDEQRRREKFGNGGTRDGGPAPFQAWGWLPGRVSRRERPVTFGRSVQPSVCIHGEYTVRGRGGLRNCLKLSTCAGAARVITWTRTTYSPPGPGPSSLAFHLPGVVGYPARLRPMQRLLGGRMEFHPSFSWIPASPRGRLG
jgi:hypothetical protein